jgi:hypothetical protein
MNNDRTIVLENVSTQSIGLKDTQGRTYRLGVGSKVRISETVLQDILDYEPSKIIFREGMAKVRNVSMEKLYNMGLTEAEIKKFSLDNYEAAIVITEEIEEDAEEAEEEIIVVEKPAPKKTTTAKKSSTTKKSTSTKKTSTSSKTK